VPQSTVRAAGFSRR